MKKILVWLTALCLLLLPVTGVLTAAATGDVSETATGVLTVDTEVVTDGTAKSGLVFDADGRVRYYENGVSVAKGLVQDAEGNIYYIWSELNGAARGSFSIPENKLNGIKPQGFYEFGADYRMIIKNGIYTHDWCDQTYYFVDSVPQAVGLARNADGDIYYFTNIYGVNRAATDGDWYISEQEANGLVPEGTYHFNQYGLMTGKSETDLKPVVPVREEIGENLFRDIDGVIRYYENGVPVAKGLVRDYEGYIYYIWNTNGFARGIFSIPENKLNGIMPQGFYEFGADGHLIIKNGIYTHDWCDQTYYFVDSIPQAVGIATDGEGHYYFFTDIYGTKRAATSQFNGGVYYVSESAANGLIEAGWYQFGADGVMIGRVESTETAETTAKPAEPTDEPTSKPAEPTDEPTSKPAEPTDEPTSKPEDPTDAPTGKPDDATENVTAEPATGTQTDGATGTGTAAGATTTAAGKSGGCASAVGVSGGVVLLLAAAAACVSRKRRL